MFLSNTSYPPDLRVAKEGKSLLRMGHTIVILCNRKEKQKKQEKIDGFLIIRILNYLHKIPKGGRLIHFLFEKYKFTLKALLISRKQKIDVIHVHDLPLVIPALLTSRILGKPLIIDFHENYTYMFQSSHEIRIITRFLCRFLNFEESIGVHHANVIIVVAEEAKKRLLKQYALDPTKIFVISNTADIQDLSEILKYEKPKKLEGFSILYVGSISKQRGLDTLITAMSLLPPTSETKSYIVGKGDKSEEQRLHRLIEKYGIKKRITIIHELDPKKTVQYMMGASICIVPHLSNPHTEATIPHKLFNYMFFKKPIIVSDLAPLQKIIKGCDCGVVFKAGDPYSLKESLMLLEQNMKYVQTMGKNAQNAVLKKYNWENEEKQLLKIYHHLSDIR